MPSPRLAKLTRPRTEGLVARERLFRALDVANVRPVVWVSGPPGAGKTSLVSGYLEARGRPYLWYQVDSGDADPATFFYYLGLAVALAVGKHTPALPLFTEEYAQDLEGFARRFFRSAYGQMEDRAVLVLDNYQEAGDGDAFHACVRIAAGELPAGHGLIGISRAEPPAALSRVRASQQMSPIGWEQLKLTADETAAIAAEAGPSTELLAELHRQSGGWAAGVVLMLERLRQTGGFRPGSAPENLETVFEYFAGQVFEAASRDTRDMLVRLSYLPRMTTATAEAVTGNPEAGKLLVTLARRNLFTDRRYGDETSYQFHALFRAFLRERAREHLGVAEHQRLAHSVAALLQATGQTEDAVGLYLESGAWDAAARLVAQETERMVRQGRRATLRRWIESLPLDIVNHDPALLYGLGICHLGASADGAAGARDFLTRAYGGYCDVGDVEGRLRAASALAESYYTDPAGMEPLDPWIDRLQTLLDTDTGALPPDLHARALLNLGRSLFYRRPMEPGVADAMKRLRACLASEEVSPDMRVFALAILIMQGYWAADMASNWALIDVADPLLYGHGVSMTSRVSYLFYKANHLLNAGRQEQAMAICAQALALVDDSGLSPLSHEFHRITALSLVYLRRYREAHERLVNEVMPYMSRLRASQRLFTYSAMAMAELGIDRRDSARRTLDKLEGDPGIRIPAVAWLMAPTRAGLWASCGELERAWELLDNLDAKFASTDCTPLIRGRAGLYRAFVAHLRGRTDDTVEELRLSLPRLASIQYTVWACHPDARFTDLFALALEHGIEPEFVTSLIRNHGIPAPDPDLEHWPWPLRIRLLGRFSLEGTLPKKAGKAQHKLNELLRAIAVRGPDGVSLQSLADELWPDSEGDAALNSAQVSLYRLRKLLGREDTIRVRDGVVYLDRSVCWVDAWAFESKAREVASIPADATGFEEAVRLALGLYLGPLLPDDDHLSGVMPVRQRLQRLWTDLVRALASRLTQDNRAEDCLDLLERGCELDPASESLCRDLMRHHTKSGDTALAVQAFERCRAALRDSLGIEVAPETQRLYREALSAGR